MRLLYKTGLVKYEELLSNRYTKKYMNSAKEVLVEMKCVVSLKLWE